MSKPEKLYFGLLRLDERPERHREGLENAIPGQTILLGRKDVRADVRLIGGTEYERAVLQRLVSSPHDGDALHHHRI